MKSKPFGCGKNFKYHYGQGEQFWAVCGDTLTHPNELVLCDYCRGKRDGLDEKWIKGRIKALEKRLPILDEPIENGAVLSEIDAYNAVLKHHARKK